MVRVSSDAAAVRCRSALVTSASVRELVELAGKEQLFSTREQSNLRLLADQEQSSTGHDAWAIKRQILLTAASKLRHSMLLGHKLLLLLLILSVGYVVHQTGMNAHATGMMWVACSSVAIRIDGNLRKEAALLFAFGTVLVEAFCVFNDATRPLETFTVEQAWGLGQGASLIAICWFLGGLAFGFQPLPAKTRSTLQAVGTLLLGVRVVVVYYRVGDQRILTVALPSTTGSFALGGLLACQLTHSAPLEEFARQLEKLEATLAGTQRTWKAVLVDYSLLKCKSQLADRHLCVICMRQLYTHAYIPCMHRCVCEDCGSAWPDSCPLCRSPSTACVRVYNPSDGLE